MLYAVYAQFEESIGLEPHIILYSLYSAGFSFRQYINNRSPVPPLVEKVKLEAPSGTSIENLCAKFVHVVIPEPSAGLATRILRFVCGCPCSTGQYPSAYVNSLNAFDTPLYEVNKSTTLFAYSTLKYSPDIVTSIKLIRLNALIIRSLLISNFSSTMSAFSTAKPIFCVPCVSKRPHS